MGKCYALAVTVALAIEPGKQRLERGKHEQIAAEFRVSTRFVNELWKKVMDQLAQGRTLDLSTAARAGRPLRLTGTKIEAIKAANSTHQGATIR